MANFCKQLGNGFFDQCGFSEGSHVELFSEAPPESYLGRLWNRHIQLGNKPRCILHSKLTDGAFLMENHQNLLGFLEEELIDSLSHFNCVHQKRRFWKSIQPVEEMNEVFYFHQNLLQFDRLRVQRFKVLK